MKKQIQENMGNSSTCCIIRDFLQTVKEYQKSRINDSEMSLSNRALKN
jgi:hypothetical protein